MGKVPFTVNLVEFQDGKEVVVNTTTIQMDEEFLEQAQKEEKDLWCNCGGADNPNIEKEYVEDYLGVDHGWICTKCGKFVQIG